MFHLSFELNTSAWLFASTSVACWCCRRYIFGIEASTMSGVDHCFLSFAATGSFILHADSSLHLMEPEILHCRYPTGLMDERPALWLRTLPGMSDNSLTDASMLHLRFELNTSKWLFASSSVACWCCRRSIFCEQRRPPYLMLIIVSYHLLQQAISFYKHQLRLHLRFLHCTE